MCFVGYNKIMKCTKSKLVFENQIESKFQSQPQLNYKLNNIANRALAVQLNLTTLVEPQSIGSIVRLNTLLFNNCLFYTFQKAAIEEE